MQMKSAALRLADDGSDPRVSPISVEPTKKICAHGERRTDLQDEIARVPIQSTKVKSARDCRLPETICSIVKCNEKPELPIARHRAARRRSHRVSTGVRLSTRKFTIFSRALNSAEITATSCRKNFCALLGLDDHAIAR
jgi:hypothetical protein